jgi:hypothetical protein
MRVYLLPLCRPILLVGKHNDYVGILPGSVTEIASAEFIVAARDGCGLWSVSSDFAMDTPRAAVVPNRS